jgi:protein-S-isoprenylcysteine O-methyltransferase Ste14
LVENLRKPVSRIFGLGWLAAAVLVMPDGFGHGWYFAFEKVGFLMLIVAALGRLWAYAYIGGRKNLELCREGPYAMTRNPLYVFSFIGVLGASLALQMPLLCLVSGLFFLGYYALVIRAEEKRLGAIFGPDFTRYCAEVPRFWPRISSTQTVSTDLTLPSHLFLRTLREIFWFLAAIVLIDIIEAAKLGGWWHVIPTPF